MATSAPTQQDLINYVAGGAPPPGFSSLPLAEQNYLTAQRNNLAGGSYWGGSRQLAAAQAVANTPNFPTGNNPANPTDPFSGAPTPTVPRTDPVWQTPPDQGGANNPTIQNILNYENDPNKGKYHSQIPDAPTHDISYTPSSDLAQQTLANLQHLHDNMSQEDFATLMHQFGGTGDPNGNGYLGDQQSTGTGQMGWKIPYTVDTGAQFLYNWQAKAMGLTPASGPGSSGATGTAAVTGAGGTGSTTQSSGSTPVAGGSSSGGQGGSASGLTSEQQNASAILNQILDAAGLGSLAGTVIDYLQQGYTDPTSIQYLLQQTPEYQRRFAANADRVKNGLGALSPAEYLSTERAYQDVLRSAGMPAGFYDSPDDFTQWIANDVSPTELSGRVSDAVKFAQSTDPTYRTALAAYYGIDTSHIAAYFLDPQRALPLLQKQANAVSIGAAALNQGLNLTDLQRANRFTDQGVTESQARQGYQQIAAFLPEEQRIAGQFGQSYDQGTAEDEVLGGLASAQRARTRLNNQETALFSGSSGTGRYAFTQQDAGAF